jgi:glutamate dehydrogenase (NAD(P)+)
VVVEAANGPSTPKADEILGNCGIIVLPDILANAGGVFVSQVEWIQNRQRDTWEEDHVNTRPATTVRRGFEHVWARATSPGISLCDASFDLAVERVVAAMHLRGCQA